MDDVTLHRITNVLILTLLIILVDFFLYRLVWRIGKQWTSVAKWIVGICFWSVTLFSVGSVAWYYLADLLFNQVGMRQWLISSLLVIYFSKFFGILFIVVDDIVFYLRRLYRFVRTRKKTPENFTGPPITRSQFLSKAALAATAIPFAGSVFGIVYGAYDYRVIKKTIRLPNLPKAFDGIRIGQISDIHANPGYHKNSIVGGVEMLMKEKADTIFFTGDLVNFRTNEVDGFISILDKVKAPLGVFSVTGNHDYGNYIWWPSEEARLKNFEEFKIAHKQLGYNLLLNENHLLQVDNEKIAIIGVENWGTGRFPKYGKLAEAYKGTEDVPVKLLLSHDPSHWDAQVRTEFPDIDVMFAGHTHGFQMGIEVGNFRWSPAQYRYKQWADLYQQDNQYLYVNRGFGCIGYLGRVGMPPELTIIELKRG